MTSARALSRWIDLTLYKTYSDLRAESRRTYIGFAWWFVDPFVNMLVFYFVFNSVLKSGIEDYLPFLLTGLVAWKWFGSTVATGANSIHVQAPLMFQVYVHKTVFPIVVLLSNGAKFLIALALLVVFHWLYGYEVGLHYAAMPLVIATQFFVVLGPTLVCAALVPFLPDINVLLENALRAMFFLSGIFYSTNDLEGWVGTAVHLNPMVIVIESYRDILMHGRWPSFDLLGMTVVGSLVLVAVGQFLINRNDLQYPKVSI